MTRHRQNWVALDDVRASIGEFLDSVGHEPLRIDVGHSTFHVTRRGGRFHVDCVGASGGWYDAREMSRRALVSYVEQIDGEVRLLRPESQRATD